MTMIESKLLKSEERAMLTLRALYKQYGYRPFKMSKFEEYDLYVKNKEFLVSDSVITFNDTDGRLLALKPDVTLSIIKNGADSEFGKQKVYYNENVYRVSGSTHLFKEIMQSGIECIGDVDVFDVYEVLELAAKSLASVSESFVLDVSHMGLISAALNNASSDDSFKREAVKLVADKNRHDLRKLCRDYSVSVSAEEALLLLVDSYGLPDEVLKRLEPISALDGAEDAYNELKTLCSLLQGSELYSKIRLDFSVVNNMSYYNGILFKGFLDGICEGVLSGGEYDVLMNRMGRESKAIGFALYLDLLEELDDTSEDYDVDVLLIYDEKTEAETLIANKNRLVSEGKNVLSERVLPSKLRYRELVDLRGVTG